MGPSAFAVVSLETPLATAPREGAPTLRAEPPHEGTPPREGAPTLPAEPPHEGTPPREGPPTLPAEPPHEGTPPRESTPPHFAAFRVRGEENGWVALETLGEDALPHCAGGIDALAPFRLRFYVPVGALAPVTQREVSQSFDDGTRIELSRGVPLTRLQRDGFFRTQLGDVSTVVHLEPSEVGTRYMPSAPLPRPAVSRMLRGDVLAAAVPVLGRTGRVESSDGSD